MPNLRTFLVDMPKPSGLVTAEWYDPTDGSYLLIGNALGNTGTMRFRPPETDSAGDGDWMLVLTAHQPIMTMDTDGQPRIG